MKRILRCIIVTSRSWKSCGQNIRIFLRRLDELEQERMIGAFDKRTIIELSRDVIKEIAKKYENVQKGNSA